MLLIYIRTGLVDHEFGRKRGSLIWDIWTFSSRIWWWRFDIIVYWINSNLLLVSIWHIVWCFWHYRSKKEVNSTIFRETDLFLLSWLFAFIWNFLCCLFLMILPIWGYYRQEHDNNLLLGTVDSLFTVIMSELTLSQ